MIVEFLEPINLKQMLLDLKLKVLETRGYVYNSKTLVNALNITRRWDIVLTREPKIHYTTFST